MLKTYRRLLEMMTPRERFRFWALVGFTFVLSAFEVVSVVAILPFLRLLAEPELIDTIPALAWVYEAGGFESVRGFQVATGIFVFIILVTGLSFKMVAIWLTTRFAMMRSFSFSSRLLSNYLNQPYEWFLSRHSSNLGNAILAEVDRVVLEGLLPAVRMIPEIFTVILLIAALCLMEPTIALSGAALLAVVYGLIFLFVRTKLLQLGEQQLSANQARFHIVQEATGGIKEVKISGLETGFLDVFRRTALRLARAQTAVQIIATVPRQVIEAIAFGGMILLILALLIQGDGNIESLIPILGLIAAIGLRLIPALQQVYSRLTNMKQADAILTRIHEDLTQLETESVEDLERRRAHSDLPLRDKLVLDNVSYAYPNTERPALDKLSLAIEANTTVGIVGGTGAGKTTLVDIMLGLLHPSDGEIRVDDTAIDLDNRRAWQRTMGYVPQSVFLSDGTMAENIAFGVERDEIDMDAVIRASKIAALHDFVESDLDNGYETEVGERGVRLSGGQRQRIGIARALYHDPSTLIFDEATSALDTLTEAAVIESIRAIAGTRTVLMIAHRLTTIRECDKIFLIRDGKVAAAGTFEEVARADAEFGRMASDITPVTETGS